MTYTNPKPLQQLSTKLRDKDLIGFDIETYGKKNHFLLAGFKNDLIQETFTEPQKVLDFLNNRNMRGKTCVATNLPFDLLSIFKNDMDKVRILERQGRFITARYIQNKDARYGVQFMDTMNIVPFSVESLGKIINVPKLEKPENLGKIPQSDNEWKYLKEYNLNDAYISFKFMKFMQDTLHSIGGELKLTISSSSLDLYKRKYIGNNKFFPQRGFANKQIFSTYKGGRVEAFKRGLIDEKVDVYDVNSLYPFVMMQSFPNPNHYRKQTIVSKKDVMENEGICHVKAFMPSHYVPSLACRNSSHLVFPTGNLEGDFTFEELRWSIENEGLQIKELTDGMIYEKSDYYFKDMMQDIYKLRNKFKSEHNPMELACKLLMNSFYGKFGYRYFDENTIVHKKLLTKKMFQEAKDINEYGDFLEIINSENWDKPKNYCMPIWASYVTAKARIHLAKTITQSKLWDNLVYCDTDSVFLKHGKHLPTSDELGDFKNEGTFNELIVIRPKLYGGDMKVKAKGLGKMTLERFKQIENNPLFEREVMAKYRTAIKSTPEHKNGLLEFNEWYKVSKLIKTEDIKRTWFDKFSFKQEQDSCPLII